LCSSLLLLSPFIAATLLYNHKISFHAAVMKRPASKLTKAVQQVNKKQSKESDLHLGARWNSLNLTAAVIKHLHVTGRDTNGFDIWAEEKDKFDIYLQRDRQLLTCPSEAFREGLYFASYWKDGIGLLTSSQLAGFLSLIDDVAESESAQAQQRGTGMGQKAWQPKYTANQSEASTSDLQYTEVF